MKVPYLTILFLGLLFVNFSVSNNADESSSEKVIPAEELIPDLSPEDLESVTKTSESHEFQAEVTRLMDIIINSLYTQREVFLRELISNSADALEKTRFLSVSAGDDASNNSSKPLEIKIDFNKDAKTISIQDSGIGMTKQDLINNLGTVAKSGTSNFLEAVAQGQGDVNLIGQFGVGFYAAFLVADKVLVASKHDDDTQHIWESSAGGSFSVAPDPRGNTLGRGTRITLHLKEDATEFLSEYKLKDLINKFNQFVSFPIYLRVEKEVEEDDAPKEEEDIEVDDGEASKEKTKKKVMSWELVNVQKAVWLRPKEEITETEYNEFYKSISHDYSDPIAHIHFSAEGEIEFKSILFIPSHAPHDQWNSYFATKQDAIKLYVRRVLVAEENYEILPKWLNFIKGVVDSDDLPLKVDRESISQTKIMSVIKNKLVRKFLDLVKSLQKEDTKIKADPEKQSEKTKFDTFWSHFSKNMKVACLEDDANRDKIVKVFRFQSSYTGEHNHTTIDQYIERMGEEQTDIYYIASDNFVSAMNSPHIHAFKKKGYEVIVLKDSLDEPCFSRMRLYDKKKLISIEKTEAKLEMTEEEKKLSKRRRKLFKPLSDAWSKFLSNRIARVTMSTKLVEDPVAIVAEAHGNSAYTERVMKAQTFADADQLRMAQKSKVLEFNPSHPLIQHMLTMAKDDASDPKLETMAETLYNWAMLASGYEVANPAAVMRTAFKLIQTEVGVPSDAPIEDLPLPEEEEENVLDDEDIVDGPDVLKFDPSADNAESIADMVRQKAAQMAGEAETAEQKGEQEPELGKEKVEENSAQKDAEEKTKEGESEEKQKEGTEKPEGVVKDEL